MRTHPAWPGLRLCHRKRKINNRLGFRRSWSAGPHLAEESARSARFSVPAFAGISSPDAVAGRQGRLVRHLWEALLEYPVTLPQPEHEGDAPIQSCAVPKKAVTARILPS